MILQVKLEHHIPFSNSFYYKTSCRCAFFGFAVRRYLAWYIYLKYTFFTVCLRKSHKDVAVESKRWAWRQVGVVGGQIANLKHGVSNVKDHSGQIRLVYEFIIFYSSRTLAKLRQVDQDYHQCRKAWSLPGMPSKGFLMAVGLGPPLLTTWSFTQDNPQHGSSFLQRKRAKQRTTFYSLCMFLKHHLSNIMSFERHCSTYLIWIFLLSLFMKISIGLYTGA